MGREGLKELGLHTICNGSAAELFQREMSAVLENMKDPNTAAKARREINLRFQFRVHEDRDGARREFTVVIVPTSKLAPKSEAMGRGFLATVGGNAVAYADDTRQELLDLEAKVEEGVAPINREAKASGGEA